MCLLLTVVAVYIRSSNIGVLASRLLRQELTRDLRAYQPKENMHNALRTQTYIPSLQDDDNYHTLNTPPQLPPGIHGLHHPQATRRPYITSCLPATAKASKIFRHMQAWKDNIQAPVTRPPRRGPTRNGSRSRRASGRLAIRVETRC